MPQRMKKTTINLNAAKSRREMDTNPIHVNHQTWYSKYKKKASKTSLRTPKGCHQRTGDQRPMPSCFTLSSRGSGKELRKSRWDKLRLHRWLRKIINLSSETKKRETFIWALKISRMEASCIDIFTQSHGWSIFTLPSLNRCTGETTYRVLLNLPSLVKGNQWKAWKKPSKKSKWV